MPFRARSVMPRPVMSSPSRMMRPWVGTRIPAMTLARVDLPPPLGPVMATKRSLMVRLMSRRISLFSPSCSTPKLMCCNSNIASSIKPPGRTGGVYAAKKRRYFVVVYPGEPGRKRPRREYPILPPEKALVQQGGGTCWRERGQKRAFFRPFSQFRNLPLPRGGFCDISNVSLKCVERENSGASVPKRGAVIG